MKTALPLRDIHLPEPISWWPPAPGWWLLAAILILFTAAIFLTQKWRNKNRLKKNTLKRLDAIYAQYDCDADTSKLVQSLSILLRRSCISYYPRCESASATGKNWLHHLDTLTNDKGFAQGVGSILATAPYKSAAHVSAIDTDQLRILCRNWLLAQPKCQPELARL